MKIVRLSEVCEVLDSKRIPVTANNRKKGIYPYYGANGIQDYVSDYIFDDELVLLAEDGGNFGSKDKPIAYRVSGKCWVNNHAHVLKPRDNINVDYLCDALKFYDVTNIINGATRKKLTQTAMLGMQIPLPDLDKQNKISLELKTCTTIIEKHRKLISKYDTLIKSRFIEMFGDPVTNPKKWEVKTLNEVCRKITDGKHGGCKLDDKSDYYYVGAREIFDLSIHYETAQKITKEDFEKDYKRCNLEIGDFCIVNTGATIGKTAIAKDEKTTHTLLQKSVALLKVKPEEIIPLYLQYSYITNESMYKVESASAQPNLLLSKIRETKLMIPPLELQNDFAAFVQQIDKSKFAVQKSLEKAETLYKSLMQEYFG